MSISRAVRPIAALAAAGSLFLLAACGNDDGAAPARPLSVTDQWVKAAPDGMTALFATLANTSDAEIRVVSGSTPVAGKVELHETVAHDGATVMKEKKDGYAIPAHGSLALTPGGDHIMLMDLKQPIVAGQTVTVDLRLADGSTEKVTAVARDFAGNQENYQP